jgi:hypothetical protein
MIAMLDTAGKDANTAVALTLIALKSTFASQASSTESEAATTLALEQCIELYEALTGIYITGDAISDPPPASIQALLYTAYDDAKIKYDDAEIASREATEQLSHATSALQKAQVELKSLELGLAAATAAALAA